MEDLKVKVKGKGNGLPTHFGLSTDPLLASRAF